MTNITEEIIAQREGAAIWISLNRPEAYNSLTPAIVTGIDAALDQIDQDLSIHALVITGVGPAFCAGADLKAVLASSSRVADPAVALKGFLEHAGRVFNRLERARVPTIAAVNGIALAGGVELALCCDMVIADEGAKLGEGHAKFAQLPGGGGSVRLPRRVGAARAKYLMFTGEMCSASRAAQWGLVDEVAPAGQLRELVAAYIEKVADKSPLGIARMKHLVQESMDQPLEVGLRAEILMSEVHAYSRDRDEGLSAFAEKRRPVYSGR